MASASLLITLCTPERQSLCESHRQRRWLTYWSYCNATAHETAFVERMSRRYKDGRRDLSWLNRAKYAELCGHVEVLLAPICA
jgi:hypothetical protein